jgi:hypothetical protein
MLFSEARPAVGWLRCDQDGPQGDAGTVLGAPHKPPWKPTTKTGPFVEGE